MLKKVIVCLLYFLPINYCVAMDDPELNRKAKDAFLLNDYVQAISYFEEYINQGNYQFSTRFNLAVSYFESGQLETSRNHFLNLVEDGFGTPRVVYSLAVAEKQLGNISEAIKFFKVVERSNSPLSETASQQLLLLNASKISNQNDNDNGNISAQIGLFYAYNNAIIDVKDDKVIREGDNYSEIFGRLSWLNFLPGGNNWDLTGLLYDSHYSTFNDQDFSLVSVGLVKGFLFSRGELFGQVDLEQSRLGHNSYMQNSMFSVGFQNSNRSFAWQIIARYTNSNSLNHIYDPYAGEERRIEAAYSTGFINNKHRLTIRGFTELIERPSVEYALFTQDLSKKRSRLSFSWRTQFKNNINVDAGINFTESRVDDYRQYTDGNSLERKESAFSYSLQVQKIIFDSWILLASYSSKDNDSNRINYNYDQGIFKLGLSVQIN